MPNIRAFFARLFGKYAPKGPFVRPSGSYEGRPGYIREYVQFEDFFAMLDDICEHTMKTGDTILNADDPREPSLGFLAVPIAPARDGFRHEKHWSITMPKLAESIERAQVSEDRTEIRKADILSKFIRSAVGRSKLAMSFPGQKDPQV